MATFTVVLKDVIEKYGYDIGLNHYPIFKEEYRRVLNKKIVEHYWNQEIGYETIQLFKLGMSRRMNEIMPYYNQLYRSELIHIEPIFTIDILTESENESTATIEGDATSHSGTESKSRSVNSEFPQHMLAGDGDYATNAADSVSDSGVDSTSSEASQTDAESRARSRTSGVQGSQADMLIRYRETFLNIDLMVIQELGDLFMSIWNNSDSYTQNNYYGGWVL